MTLEKLKSGLLIDLDEHQIIAVYHNGGMVTIRCKNRGEIVIYMGSREEAEKLIEEIYELSGKASNNK